jgi:hypothetical protein
MHPPTLDTDCKKDAPAGCMERLVRFLLLRARPAPTNVDAGRWLLKIMKMQLPQAMGGRNIEVPAAGTRVIRRTWEWKTGTLLRETRYTTRDGCGSGCQTDTLLCLWGWLKAAPRPPHSVSIYETNVKVHTPLPATARDETEVKP